MITSSPHFRKELESLRNAALNRLGGNWRYIDRKLSPSSHFIPTQDEGADNAGRLTVETLYEC